MKHLAASSHLIKVLDIFLHLILICIYFCIWVTLECVKVVITFLLQHKHRKKCHEHRKKMSRVYSLIRIGVGIRVRFRIRCLGLRVGGIVLSFGFLLLIPLLLELGVHLQLLFVETTNKLKVKKMLENY